MSRLPRACPPSGPSPAKRCCSTSRQVWPHSLSSHSAASAIRRSPGGSTPNSSRSRPDEPPSSATVTTAVTWSVTWRRAVSVAARPWPPPECDDRGAAAAHSRPRSRCTTKVATWSVAQPRGERLGHRHRAVLAAGAADGDGDVAACPPAGSPAVTGAIRSTTPVEELGGALLAQHVVAPPGRPAPVSGRSSGTQNGLGRKRMSKTKSASSGTPYLKPNDISARRTPGPSVAAEAAGSACGRAGARSARRCR